jgi:Flp pilus assembly protein TadG
MKKDESSSGQSLLEFAMILPLVLGLSLGVIEVGYALLDQHVITKLAREGSNLISRNTTMVATGDVMRSMSTRPVNFNAGGGSRLILSVIKKGAVGTANACCDVLYQRYEVGNLAKASLITSAASSGSWQAASDYTAPNADTNTSLRVTGGLPAGLVSVGSFVYVSEIWTAHPLITPFDRFGIVVPQFLYSIAYF